MGDLKRQILVLVLAALLLVVGISEGASDSREVVQASEILAKIERGEPVEYDGVTVEGDLDLSELDLPTEHVEITEFEVKYQDRTEEVEVVESHITITNSKIRGGVTFSNAIFQKSANFTGTNFSGDAFFDWAQFNGDYAGFNSAQFCGGADFNSAQFCGDALFDGAQFCGDYADFNSAQFSGGNADFSGAQFSGGNADFSGAQFSGDAYFIWAQFCGDASFDGAQFNRNLYSVKESLTIFCRYLGGRLNL